MHPLFRSLAVILIASTASHAEIIIKGQNSTTALAYASDVSSTDLINAGQSSLASASVTASYEGYPGSAVNDGVCSNTGSANAYFMSGVHFPAAATYRLNLSSAPNGYDITSIISLMGWYANPQSQANQNYTVEVSVVGAAGFRTLAYVQYTPFTDNGGNYETKVTVTEGTTGVLARNVNAIRFIFVDPGNNRTNSGTVIREIDMTGSPSVTKPPTVAVQAVTDFSVIDDAYAGYVVNDDLVNKEQSTLAAFTSSTAPEFGAGGENDGVSGLDSRTAAVWYRPAQLPATLSFDLNTTASPNGYVVSAIRTFAGWKNGDTQCYANQKYKVEYRKVGSSAWLSLTNVDFSPFSSLVSTPACTRVEIRSPSGSLLSGVASLRFTLLVPTRAHGTTNGTILQEIDVIGYPVKAPNRQ